MVKSLILATFILSLSACSPAANNSSTGDVSTTEGIFDPQFYENMGTGFNGAVTSLARDGKDKMIVGGEFLKFKGTTAGGIAKIFETGKLDESFSRNTGLGFNNTVRSVLRLEDGSILVGGEFSTYNGRAVSRLVRLESNGTLDTTFEANLAGGPDSAVYAITVSEDGSIFIGGAFVKVGSFFSSGIAKISAKGVLDRKFAAAQGTGVLGSVHSLQLLPNDQLLAGGKFNTVNGNVAKNIVVINKQGALEGGFLSIAATAFSDAVYALALDSDGKWILGGAFTQFANLSAARLLRLDSKGALDEIPTPTGGGFSGNSVRTIKTQSDGKILVAGDFTALSGTARPYLVRLNSDFSVDEKFHQSLGKGPTETVNALALDGSGKLFVGGSFSKFDNNVVGYLVRLK